MTLKDLQPAGIFKYFGEISCIPRASKHEEKIITYLLEFAAQHDLLAKRDAVGNVLISKPASKGMEDRPTVILQSHMDMVCEKNSHSKHNFDTDPIPVYIDEDWVKAMDTTLGADCGIGMAAQLALLEDNSLEHGPIECLFTVDEETGLTGANAIEPDFLKGRILLNLDSEDEGEIFIGCAGGTGVIGTFDYEKESMPKNHRAYNYSVSGLIGGHSGDDINKGRANAIKIATRFLWQAQQYCQIRIKTFSGGNLRNAIAREATAMFTVDTAQATLLSQLFEQHTKDIKTEYSINDPEIVQKLDPITLKPEDKISVLDRSSQQRLLNVLYACPHGVMAMSSTVEGLVETSTNLASVKFTTDQQLVVETSQRSSIESAKFDIARMVDSVFFLAEAAEIEHGDGYPGWAPNPNSPILEISKNSYKRLFLVDPQVKAIHAGLECGLFLSKYPDLDMISFGPTVKNAHSPDEKLHIPSVEKFWYFLLDILRNI